MSLFCTAHMNGYLTSYNQLHFKEHLKAFLDKFFDNQQMSVNRDNLSGLGVIRDRWRRDEIIKV